MNHPLVDPYQDIKVCLLDILQATGMPSQRLSMVHQASRRLEGLRVMEGVKTIETDRKTNRQQATQITAIKTREATSSIRNRDGVGQSENLAATQIQSMTGLTSLVMAIPLLVLSSQVILITNLHTQVNQDLWNA